MKTHSACEKWSREGFIAVVGSDDQQLDFPNPSRWALRESESYTNKTSAFDPEAGSAIRMNVRIFENENRFEVRRTTCSAPGRRRKATLWSLPSFRAWRFLKCLSRALHGSDSCRFKQSSADIFSGSRLNSSSISTRKVLLELSSTPKSTRWVRVFPRGRMACEVSTIATRTIKERKHASPKLLPRALGSVERQLCPDTRNMATKRSSEFMREPLRRHWVSLQHPSRPTYSLQRALSFAWLQLRKLRNRGAILRLCCSRAVDWERNPYRNLRKLSLPVRSWAGPERTPAPVNGCHT